MPCLNLSTNVNLDGVDTSSILSEATSTVASIIGKPEAVRWLPHSPFNVSVMSFYACFRFLKIPFPGFGFYASIDFSVQYFNSI